MKDTAINLIKFSAALSTLAFCSLAQGQDAVKLGAWKTSAFLAPEIGRIVAAGRCDDASPSCKDFEPSYGLVAGWQFEQPDHFFGLEVGYRYADGFRREEPTETLPNEISMQVREKDFGALTYGGRFSIGRRLAFTGKAGFHEWKTTESILDTSEAGAMSESVLSKKGSDTYYGVGLRLPYSRKFSLHVEYTRYNVPDGDYEVTSAGMLWYF